MTATVSNPKPKEVVIVIDDPRTGRAHLEFPEPGDAAPEGDVPPRAEGGGNHAEDSQVVNSSSKFIPVSIMNSKNRRKNW